MALETTKKVMSEYFEKYPKLIATSTIALLGVSYILGTSFNYPKNRKKSTKKPLNVVIIGSSKGIGFGLAKYFLKYEDNVLITSRNENSLNNALNKLKNSSNSKNIKGNICDITNPDSLKNLYNNNKNIDIIINNAGYIGAKKHLYNVSCNDIENIVKTNLYGTLISNKLAIQSRINENNNDKTLHIFNMAGAGTKGMPSQTPTYLTYATTKGGIGNIKNTLNAELKKDGLSDKIKIHLLNPGMVWTSMLANGDSTVDGFNAIAVNTLTNTVDDVGEYLVTVIRGIVLKNGKTYEVSYYGNHPVWYILGRFLRAVLFGYNKNKYIDSKGNRQMEPL